MEPVIRIDIGELLSGIPQGTDIETVDPGYGVPEKIKALGNSSFRDMGKNKPINKRDMAKLIQEGHIGILQLAELSGIKVRLEGDLLLSESRVQEESRDLLLMYLETDPYISKSIRTPEYIAAYGYDLYIKKARDRSSLTFLKEKLFEKPIAILRAEGSGGAAALIISDSFEEPAPKTTLLDGYRSYIAAVDSTGIPGRLEALQGYLVYMDKDISDAHIYDQPKDKDERDILRKVFSDTGRELDSKPLGKADALSKEIREIIREAQEEMREDEDEGEETDDGLTPEMRKRLKKMSKKTTLEEVRANIKKAKK